MEKTLDIEQKRSESLQRLIESPGRSKDRSPFWENMINKFSFNTPFLCRLFLHMAGINLGRNVRFLGAIRVKLRGNPNNIIIGNNVVLGKNIDLRIRENGKIVLHDKVYLDDNVRIVAARDGRTEIEVGTEVGSNTVINSGGETTIGQFCMIGSNVQINSQNHTTSKERYIKDQSYEFGKIIIGSDVWIGSSSAVSVNTTIGDGAVIGGNSLATGVIPPFAVCVGSPAKVVRYRE